MTKPVWKRTFDGTVYADFFDGNGIRQLDTVNHVWGDTNEGIINYNNEQPTADRPNGSGLYVVFMQGCMVSTLMGKKATKAWNKAHGFTPYIRRTRTQPFLKALNPKPTLWDRQVDILNRMDKAERDFLNAIDQIKKATHIVENYPYIKQGLALSLQQILHQEGDILSEGVNK
tara:strand:+ start:6612 stop:7130 length:519 start_codon:yes stop_codon:yes gene_type:complete